MIPLLADRITWIKVPPPQLDLVGIVLGSLGLAAAFALVALSLGVLLGLALIRRGRREAVSLADGALHLDLSPDRL